MDYKQIVEDIVTGAGGKDNISGATHCVTRLRLTLNEEKFDKEKLENIDGAKGVFFNKGQLQIVFGTGLVDRVTKHLLKNRALVTWGVSKHQHPLLLLINRLKDRHKNFSRHSQISLSL